MYQGVAEKQGVSLAQGIGLYAHTPSPPFTDLSALAYQLREAMPVLPLGGWRKKGAGDFM